MRTTQVVTKTRKTCFCNHCKTNGFTRLELNAALLCPTCAAMPGVRGYRDPNLRGLERNGAESGEEYYKRTQSQLTVVTNDDGKKPGAAAPFPALDTTAPSPTPALNGFQCWQKDVLADTTLSADNKLYLVMLTKFADFGTGANCFPSYQEQADALGLSIEQIRRLRRRVIAAGWIVGHQRRTSWRRTSALHQFSNPRTGWQSPATLKYGELVATPCNSIECSGS